MKSENESYLRAQLAHWRIRKRELENWLTNHSYTHVDYLQNIRDYNACGIKIESLETRLSNLFTYRNTSGLETFSIPQLRH